MNDPSPQSDAALIRRIGDGDGVATRLVVDRYLDRIVAYGYRMLGDVAEAEDVAQEAFLRLWRQAPRWRADAPVIHWLHKVTYNLCIDRLRKRTPVSIETVPEPRDSAIGPAGEIHRSQLSAAIDAAIQALPERQRAAVVFVHQEGLNNIQTAEAMGVSVEAVESLLARGRRALRASLAAVYAETKGDV